MMVVRLLQKLKFEYSSFVAREPALAPLYWPKIWWQQYKIWRPHSDEGGAPTECFVSQSTEFVLDGFQGSANSFATQAFRASQDRHVEMARSMHAPAQIIKAVRRSIPTLVTLRHPVGAVLSLTSRWPYVSPHQALRSYVGFYSKIEPYRDGYVLSPFEHTTQHLDVVIQRVNDRFDTDFAVYDPAVSEMERKHGPEETASAEERNRATRKSEKKDQLNSPGCAALLRTAKDLHRRMKATTPDLRPSSK
jgi:hypothetical protein